MNKLSNKVAYITGGAMGNGRGAAAVFAKHGASVILADISDQVFSTEEELRKKGYDVKAYKVDIRDFEEVKSSVDAVLLKYGKIDVLFNNAGISRLESFLTMSDAKRDLHFDINIKGAWNCAKAILPSMVERRYGKIINMSSVTGPMVADPGETAYATTKAALLGFTKSLAREFAPYHINVNAILPGYILTPMVQKSAEESCPENPKSVIEGIARNVPMGRFGTPEELGELVAFLACNESAYITGTGIVLDGGSTLPETNTMGVG